MIYWRFLQKVDILMTKLKKIEKNDFFFKIILTQNLNIRHGAYAQT